MSDRFWMWALLTIAFISTFVGIATDMHYLVTNGLILLAIAGIGDANRRLRDLERRDR